MLVKPAAKRRAAEAGGRMAEDAVAAFLEARGYQTLAGRLRSPAGEIDLILADARTLIFVEVKSRQSAIEAVYAIPPRQQARLLAAADAALALHPDWQREDTRFDVALVCGERIEIIEDAIRP